MRGEEIQRYLSPRIQDNAKKVIYMRFEEGLDIPDILLHVDITQQRANKIIKDFEKMIFEDGFIKRTSYQRPGKVVRML